MNIVFVGSGNLATHLSLALQQAGHDIRQVYSRTLHNAQALADRLNMDSTQQASCQATSSVSEIKAADCYIFSVKDDALPELAQAICPGREESIFIHTAGSEPMDVFKGTAARYGVLYPMQTFSKAREVNFREIPCFVEGSDEQALSAVETLAKGVSDAVVGMDSARRRYLHLAAVFACNLTNHCYRLAEKTLAEQGIDFSLFQPLILETARKVSEMTAKEAQTGPMVRYDTKVMERQLELIPDERTRQIYRLMAESIHEDSKR